MSIKKTMVDALAFVTEHGNMSAENLELFTNDYCIAKGRATASGEPREIVRLFDEEGNTIGRRCSVFKLWLAPAGFNGDIEKMSISREANKLKTANLRKAEGIVRDAEVIRDEANDLEDPMEKLAKYEEFDAKLEEAKSVKTATISPDDVADGTEDMFETIEELADALGVDVITEKPAEETTEEA